MLKKSLISVILPVYNAGKYLPSCVESLLGQSYANIEIIAIDDKSKDDSVQILNSFKKKFNKTGSMQIRRIQILKNKKHYGTSVCLNRAVRHAQGQFITFMNPFDYISPHKFKTQIAYLLNHKNTVAVGSQFTTVGVNNKIISKSALPEEHDAIYNEILHAFPLKPEAVIINRMLVPKDLLRFTTHKYPLLFTEVFIKLFNYGKITNLSRSYYKQRVGIRRYTRRHGKIKHTFSMFRLLLKSRSSYDYKPTIPFSLPYLKSLLQPRFE